MPCIHCGNNPNKPQSDEFVSLFGDSVEFRGVHKGLIYEIVKQKLGHRCGYVYVPHTNPLYNIVDFYEEPFAAPFQRTVHGDVTFNRLTKNKAHRVIGFDTAHLHDDEQTQLLKSVQLVCQNMCEAASYFNL